ncbi:ABC-type nitrate/sulfonate/bicarbonate transport system, permease component [Rhizobium sp. RU36D]|nr:ABC-type nitrate/sulfonate/bicarbonate transport system, permease component [Rhizobium sp. RU36D]
MASVAVLLLFILLWHFVSVTRLVPATFLPSPTATYKALSNGFSRGQLSASTASTVWRMLVGWGLACLVGIALGCLIGMSERARAYLAPMLEAIRPLPTSALIPVFIAIFGLSEGMILGAIAFGAIWPMMLATINGIAGIDPALRDLAKSLKMSTLAFLTKIALPSAMPEIMAAIRLGLTVALVLAVVGEMLSGRTGLGQWLLVSARSFATPNLFAGVVILGVIGFTANTCLQLFEARVLRWRQSAR